MKLLTRIGEWHQNLGEKIGLIFLPPANEVWSKVMFLHLSVILFTGGVSVQGGLCLGGSLSKRGEE